MKATEQYFLVVMYIMLCKVVLTFEYVDELLRCDHSNESYWAVLSCGTVFILYKVVLTLMLWMHKMRPFAYFLRFGTFDYVVQGRSNFDSVDETS